MGGAASLAAPPRGRRARVAGRSAPPTDRATRRRPRELRPRRWPPPRRGVRWRSRSRRRIRDRTSVPPGGLEPPHVV
ncbi:MAG TPA: hypothetical protein DCY40_09860 [Actinobacteria bacterium]|nr:hypothetical protein [Actinomycetota bacterium]